MQKHSMNFLNVLNVLNFPGIEMIIDKVITIYYLKAKAEPL